MSDKKLKGIYIHIPFCKHKCSYCSFYSEVDTDESVKSKYITRLIEEIQKSKTELISIYNTFDDMETLYIGGGTPSLIPAEDLKRLLQAIEDTFQIKIQDLKEITIEANPGTVDLNYLTNLRELGFNRLSLGVQSLNENILRRIQRIHSRSEAISAIENAEKAGFDNISVDIMFGIPNQTINDLKDTLDEILSFPAVKHISAYSLIVEEGTPLFNDLESGKLELPEEDLEREMQYFINDYLKENGFEHYEISNYARSGFESNHNTLYWTLNDYIGYGAGASSYINNERIDNHSLLKEFINRNLENTERNLETLELLKSDFIILGLRMLRGINTQEYQKLFNSSIFSDYTASLDKLMSRGLIKIQNNFIQLTPKGLDLANQVFIEFI